MSGVLGLAPAYSLDSGKAYIRMRADLRLAIIQRAKDLGIPASAIEDVSYSPTSDVVAEYMRAPDGFIQSVVEQVFPEICESCSASGDSGVSGGFPGHKAVMPYADYNAQVFAGIPAGGICQIRQDFSATVSNYKVTSKKILGSAYVVGLCLFAWTPNRAWFSQSGREFNVYMKGTFSALIKGSPMTFSATFRAIYDINRSALKQHFQ